MLGQMGAACFAPILGIVVGRRVVDAGKMEGFTPLDAGATAAAMPRAALVAGPCFRKRHAEPRTLAHDVGFALAQKRGCESNLPQAVEREALHRGESVDERRPTV